MRLIEFIIEAPLGDIETYGDFEPDLDPLITHPSVPGHISIDNPSKKLLTGDLKKYRDAFSKTPFTFNFYFYSRSESADESTYHQIKKEINKSIELKGPNDINIIMTNNVTTKDDYMPMTPWILAHRIAHVFMMPAKNKKGEISDREFGDLDEQLMTLLMKITNLYNPRPMAQYSDDHAFSQDHSTKHWLDQLWPYIGTMKTARRGKVLASSLDFGAELMAQYLITGAVTARYLKFSRPSKKI